MIFNVLLTDIRNAVNEQVGDYELGCSLVTEYPCSRIKVGPTALNEIYCCIIGY